MKEILVFAEQDQGKLERVGLELVSKAVDLAGKLKARVSALVIGNGMASSVSELTAFGADRVYLAQDTALGHYNTDSYSRITVKVIQDVQPDIVLYGATPVGRDLAPRVASQLRVGLTADCTELEIGDHTMPDKTEHKDILYQIRPAFGGNIIATIVSPLHRPQMATVRGGVMPMGTQDASRKGETVDIDLSDVSLESGYTVTDRISSEKKVDLTSANIIVAGGMGVGNEAGFNLIRELADVLGGVPGASRAAVDAGFIDKEFQVGQTGTTVRPKLYIACGISGQIQHRAGMMESSKIVAVDTDPNAPIFQIAHYGIVGDLNKVIPMMIKAYRSKGN